MVATVSHDSAGIQAGRTPHGGDYGLVHPGKEKHHGKPAQLKGSGLSHRVVPSPSVPLRYLLTMGRLMVDLFAMNRINNLQIYISPYLDPMVWKEDVFQHPGTI